MLSISPAAYEDIAKAYVLAACCLCVTGRKFVPRGGGGWVMPAEALFASSLWGQPEPKQSADGCNYQRARRAAVLFPRPDRFRFDEKSEFD